MTTTVHSGVDHPEPEVIDPEFFRNPDDAIRWLHDSAPVYFYDPRPRYPEPLWILSRWEDIRAVESNPEVFCSGQGITLQHGTQAPKLPDDPRFPEALMMPTLFDPPLHTRHRRLVRDHFRPSRMRALEEPVRAVVSDCLDAVEAGDVADFTELVANRVPLYLICDLLGVSRSQSADFMRWAHAIFASFEPGSEGDFGPVIEMFDFFEAEIADRRTSPKDDLITDLVHARVDGEAFSLNDMIMWCWVFLVAGQDTTACLLGGGAKALLDNPDEKAKLLADPALTRNAVEEMLRWVTPTWCMLRTATRDTQVRGVDVPAGAKVYLSYLAANRDPEVYADPYRFDVTRSMERESLSFGFGPHYCLGAPLSRLEGRIVFEELLRRFPNIEWGGEPVRALSTVSNFPGVIPVRFLP